MGDCWSSLHSDICSTPHFLAITNSPPGWLQSSGQALTGEWGPRPAGRGDHWEAGAPSGQRQHGQWPLGPVTHSVSGQNWKNKSNADWVNTKQWLSPELCAWCWSRSQLQPSEMSTTVFSLAIIKSCYALNLMKLENIFFHLTFHVRAALCELPFEFLDWSECLVFTGLARPASAAWPGVTWDPALNM